MPVAERFTFLVTTLLTDVAAKCETVREEVLNTQVEVLSALTNVIIRAAREDSLLSANGKSMSLNLLKMWEITRLHKCSL